MIILTTNYSTLKFNKSEISTCIFLKSKTHWWKVKIQQKWNKKYMLSAQKKYYTVY